MLNSLSGSGQTITNGQLVGTPGFDNTPTSWMQIPFTDPISEAFSAIEATSDVLDPTGPSTSGGIAGIAQIGSTYTSGLHCAIGSSYLWHEGIMQDITGFTVGNNYELSFYQTVVKQTNSIDQSGSWRVYLDGVLIGTTAVSTSLLSPNDINLVWDNRIINFTATSTTHTLKCIPWDDDPNIQASETDITGGLRMGIDNIEIIVTSPTPPIVNLGTDQTLCVGDSLLLDATYPNSTYLWQDGSTDSVLSVYQSGLYWVEVTNIYGTTTDSITVSEMISPMIQLGPDTIMCISETFILSSANVDVDYL